jgi:hypothetical protein
LFKSEFKYTPDGRLIWHYWPGVFYNGWSTSDDISNHMPTKSPEVDNLYEDTSHASLNIAFIFRFMEIHGTNIFTSRDISALQKTLENIRYGRKYSYYMSGDTDYQPASIMFRPGFSLIKLNDVVLQKQYARGMAAYWPFFERAESTTLIYLINGK